MIILSISVKNIMIHKLPVKHDNDRTQKSEKNPGFCSVLSKTPLDIDNVIVTDFFFINSL